MGRRLLASYLALTACVLAVLVVPLGLSYSHNQRQDLTAKVERDAVVLTTFAEDLLGGRPGISRASLEEIVTGYEEDTGARVVVVDSEGLSVVDSADPGGPVPVVRVASGAGASARDGRRRRRRPPLGDARRGSPLRRGSRRVERSRVRRRSGHLSDVRRPGARAALLVDPRRRVRRRPRRRRRGRDAARALDHAPARRGGARRDRGGSGRSDRASARGAGPAGGARARRELQRDGREARRADALARGVRRRRFAPATHAAGGASPPAREPRVQPSRRTVGPTSRLRSPRSGGCRGSSTACSRSPAPTRRPRIPARSTWGRSSAERLDAWSPLAEEQRVALAGDVTRGPAGAGDAGAARAGARQPARERARGVPRRRDDLGFRPLRPAGSRSSTSSTKGPDSARSSWPGHSTVSGVLARPAAAPGSGSRSSSGSSPPTAARSPSARRSTGGLDARVRLPLTSPDARAPRSSLADRRGA